MRAKIVATFKAKDYGLVTAIIRSLGEAATKTEVIYEKEEGDHKVRVICRKTESMEKNPE